MSSTRGVELESTTLALINAIAYAAGSSAHARRFTAATGLVLPAAHVRLLEHLEGRTPTTATRVATETAVDLAQVSRQVSELADAGLIERRADVRDRRRRLITLSRRGRTTLDHWLRAWSPAYAEPAAELSAEECTNLAAWLRTVHTALEAALPDQPPSTVAERWRTLADPVGSPDAQARHTLVCEALGLAGWIGESAGFTALLASLGSPLGQHEFMALRSIAHAGTLNVSEIMEETGSERTQCSRRLSRLQDLGFVARTVSTHDRRSATFAATPEGTRLVREIRQAQLEAFCSILPPISGRDRRQWTDPTRRYVSALLGADASAHVHR